MLKRKKTKMLSVKSKAMRANIMFQYMLSALKNYNIHNIEL